MSRGDGAVLAASRELAAREAAQAKVAELERVVSRLRRDLATARSTIKDHAERVRAKEEARAPALHTHPQPATARRRSQLRRWRCRTCSRRRQRIGAARCEQSVTQPLRGLCMKARPARTTSKHAARAVAAQALSRLEDVHSLTTQQLEKDSACCRTESRASGQAREAQKQAEGRLYRCAERPAAEPWAKRRDGKRVPWVLRTRHPLAIAQGLLSFAPVAHGAWQV